MLPLASPELIAVLPTLPPLPELSDAGFEWWCLGVSLSGAGLSLLLLWLLVKSWAVGAVGAVGGV